MQDNLRYILSIIVLCTCLSLHLQAQPFPFDLKLGEQGPDSFLVSFKTTKATFVMKAHRNWSPLGSDRLYHLAKSGYYNGCVIYRVAPTKSIQGGFVVQFGVGNNVSVNLAWNQATLKDEPVVHGHRRGIVSFARGGLDSRTVELAIDVAPNAPLDTITFQGASGLPPIAEVVEGMDVVDSFNRQYGNSVFDHEDSLLYGRTYFDRAYPGLDRIESVAVIKSW